jgi:hypothetical protein
VHCIHPWGLVLFWVLFVISYVCFIMVKANATLEWTPRAPWKDQSTWRPQPLPLSKAFLWLRLKCLPIWKLQLIILDFICTLKLMVDDGIDTSYNHISYYKWSIFDRRNKTQHFHKCYNKKFNTSHIVC